MKYKIAVCDDSDADRQYIADLVNLWAKNREHTVQIFPFKSAESFLFQYTEDKEYDILLLDIEMGEMDGVTMAKRLRQEDDAVQIIFITGYSDYISEGYEVDALHYLMKPVKEAKLMDQKISSYQRELIETHYQEVDNMYRQIRGWRHDYRNHIQTMKAYAASEDWDAI